jgi:hypothetical protein
MLNPASAAVANSNAADIPNPRRKVILIVVEV